MTEIKFEDLLGTGAHFGHVTRKWNPNFKPYILLEKNGVHIINLEETIQAIDRASKFIKEVVGKNGEILFVGTNRPRTLFSRKQTAAACSMLLNGGWVVP